MTLDFSESPASVVDKRLCGERTAAEILRKCVTHRGDGMLRRFEMEQQAVRLGDAERLQRVSGRARERGCSRNVVEVLPVPLQHRQTRREGFEDRVDM